MQRTIVLLFGLAAGLTGCQHTLPAAQGHVRVLPLIEDDSIPIMDVCWLEFSRLSGPNGVATQGPTEREFDGTISGILVKHPRGHYLIDTGEGANIKEHLKEVGFFNRIPFKLLARTAKPVVTAPEALKAAGSRRLRKILLTHSHWDHAGGVTDLPRVKVLLQKEEARFIEEMSKKSNLHVVPAHARKIKKNGIERIQFNDGPYETFDESADLVGDGSIVVVKLNGHTPGHIGVFVNLSLFSRFFLVGDAVLTTEGIDRRRHKGFPMSRSDHNRKEAGEIVARLNHLQEAAPEVVIIPAHDRAAYQTFFGSEPRCFSVK